METSLSLLASKTVQSKHISIIIDLQQKIHKKNTVLQFDPILPMDFSVKHPHCLIEYNTIQYNILYLTKVT